MTAKYQTYPEYKDSGVEWLGSIPKHWGLKRVKEAAKLINGFPFDSRKFESGKGIPLVRIRDIYSCQTEVGFDGEVPPTSLIDTGDVLIGMDGDFNVARWKGGKAALNQRVACVRASSPELMKFIYYSLPFSMKIINDLTYYTTVKHLSSIDIDKTIFSCPPKHELRSIVNFLDHETAKIDTLIEKQQQLIKLLKEKRHAVISHAVTKGLNPNAPMRDSGIEWLGEVPEHWEIKRLKFCCDLLSNKISTIGEKVVALENIESWTGKFIETDSGYSGEDVEFSSGDILFGKLRPYLAKVYFAEGRGVAFGDLLAYRPNKGFIGKYCFYQMLTEEFISTVDSSTYGSKMPRASSEFIGDMPMLVPPANEQEEIIQKVETVTNQFEGLMEKSLSAINLMKERRTALISAAATGKIDVRNHG